MQAVLLGPETFLLDTLLGDQCGRPLLQSRQETCPVAPLPREACSFSFPGLPGLLLQAVLLGPETFLLDTLLGGTLDQPTLQAGKQSRLLLSLSCPACSLRHRRLLTDQRRFLDPWKPLT
ncbi:hypothetical protein [Deinococcus budaensis]|uniref:Uncharacterized protein n=1 Tax=Deinococcus budaensis TaxID=1665626 RepID=A0A7W8LRE7_9DEIO|nr:hypothetical protein [Deinococcus budaensis]MBB5235552.1 hypothetical protein [Deinococcus budaensis]